MIAQAQAGDPHAFGELGGLYASRLLRQAVLLCGDSQSAADLSQETLVQAWRSIRRYQAQSAFFTWLCGILIHRHKSWLRKQSRRRTTGSEEDPPPDESNSELIEPTTPDQMASRVERNLILRRCLGRLPDRQRAVIYLRFYVDERLEEIAAALNCSVGTVKSRLFHGLNRLSKMKELQSLSKE